MGFADVVFGVGLDESLLIEEMKLFGFEFLQNGGDEFVGEVFDEDGLEAEGFAAFFEGEFLLEGLEGLGELLLGTGGNEVCAKICEAGGFPANGKPVEDFLFEGGKAIAVPVKKFAQIRKKRFTSA